MDDLLDPPTGRAKGGVARAAKLSPERRSEIARKAALSRHNGNRMLRATHKGNFIDDFGIDVECYVLADDAKTAVISQRGMALALGLGDGGSRLPMFMQRVTIAPYVGHELREKLENPLIFQPPILGANQPATTVHGYDVTILIDVCKAVLAAKADGNLLRRQEHIARQAQIIVNASAKSGIQGLVYKLAGYDASREEVVAAFKFFVREEAREYEKEFPDMLYSEWYRLYQLPKPERNKPWKFKSLTVDHVYHPLARSYGRVHQLAQAHRDASGERGKKLHQFLSDVGVKALRTHLGQLLGIARISKSREEYEDHVQTLFGQQPDLFKQ